MFFRRVKARLRYLISFDFAPLYYLGPMLGFFKYLRRKIWRTNWRFSFKAKINYAKVDHIIGF
jgi:hypothetical protein